MAVQISGNDITVPRDTTVTRNLTVGGVLTYEDVTNVDSVGLVTARTGIEIGARPGVAASISVDGNAIFSGITTVGVLTVTNNTHIGDNLVVGGDMTVQHSGLSVNLFESTDSHSRLRIKSGSASNTQLEFGDQDDVDAGEIRYDHSTDKMTFHVGNNTERVGIASNGKVGIGTNNPQKILHAISSENSVARIETTAATGRLEFKASGTTTIPYIEWNTNDLKLETGGSERLRITGIGGSVGINTSSPASILDVNGAITANGSFYQENPQSTGDDAQDKTVEFNRRGVFLVLISYSLGTTTTDINRNVYSLGLFVSRSNGATWVPIQQDLNSTHVGNLTISDASARGKLRIQKSSGSDNRICAFRIDVLSSADVAITVTDT